MSDIVVTFDVFQLQIFWLKSDACRNISDILVTLKVFQLQIFWLKAQAPLKTLVISVTFVVFQLFIVEDHPLLKALAAINILDMLVTLLISQAPIS